MNLKLVKKAKIFLKDSMSQGRLDQEQAREQLNNIRTQPRGQRLKLLRLYRALIEKRLRQETVLVQTSTELDSGAREELERKIQSRFGGARIEYESVASLIGGVRVIFRDTSFDYSIKGRLEEIKEALA
jgi:F0F1-type ATP synthase delta subunit